MIDRAQPSYCAIFWAEFDIRNSNKNSYNKNMSDNFVENQ